MPSTSTLPELWSSLSELWLNSQRALQSMWRWCKSATEFKHWLESKMQFWWWKLKLKIQWFHNKKNVTCFFIPTFCQWPDVLTFFDRSGQLCWAFGSTRLDLSSMQLNGSSIFDTARCWCTRTLRCDCSGSHEISRCQKLDFNVLRFQSCLKQLTWTNLTKLSYQGRFGNKTSFCRMCFERDNGRVWRPCLTAVLLCVFAFSPDACCVQLSCFRCLSSSRRFSGGMVFPLAGSFLNATLPLSSESFEGHLRAWATTSQFYLIVFAVELWSCLKTSMARSRKPR